MSTASTINRLITGRNIGSRNTSGTIQFAPNDPVAARGPRLANPSQWRFITGAGKPNLHFSADGKHVVIDDGLTFTGLTQVRR